MKLGEWSGAVVEPATGGSPPAADEWESVDLPGSPGRLAGADCVAYRTRFDDPREGDQTRALLTLRGLYARTRVWLNGDPLGTHDTYFEPARFVFEPEADNELVVECRRPADRFGGVHESDLLPADARVPGVWWGAEVEGLSEVALLDVQVRPRLDGGTGVFDVRLTVDAAREVDDSVTFSVRPEGFRGGGMMERSPVSAAAGARTTVEHTVAVEEPELWYPRGYGDQHRYTLAAKLGGREVAVSTGLADVEYDDDGFRVNGRRVPLRGFNVLPVPGPDADGGPTGTGRSAAADGPGSAAADGPGSAAADGPGSAAADERSTAAANWSAAADVRRAAEANATLVRAHAHVPPQELYAACDEAGLLVWQDLPLTGEGGYDIDRARDLARAMVRRYRHHPSLGAFGVHDDPRDPFPGPLGDGRTGRTRLRWRAWRTGYNASADEAVAEAFPDEAAVFPVVGPVGTDPDATTLYPGWDYGEARDVDWLLARNPELGRVVAEFGAGALAGDPVEADAPGEVAAAADGVGDVAGFDRGKHDARVGGGVEASQAYQARVVKTVAEALRRHGSHALAAFSLRDADVAGTGVLARDGTPKAAYEAVAAAYEPVQVVLDGDPADTVGTTVLNDTPAAVSGTVSWRAGDEEGTAEVAVDAHDSADGPEVTVPADAGAVALELQLPDRTVENRYPL